MAPMWVKFQFFTSRHHHPKKKNAHVLACTLDILTGFCFDIPQQICWHICWHFHGKTYFDIILDRTDTFNYDNILAFYDLITLHVTCVLTCSLDMLYISLSLQTVQTWWYLVCHKFCHVIWDMFWNIFQHFTCHKFWHLQLILGTTYSDNNQWYVAKKCDSCDLQYILAFLPRTCSDVFSAAYSGIYIYSADMCIYVWNSVGSDRFTLPSKYLCLVLLIWHMMVDHNSFIREWPFFASIFFWRIFRELHVYLSRNPC